MVVKWLNSNLSANIGGTKAKYFASLQFIVVRWYKKIKNKNYYFNTLSLFGFGGRGEERENEEKINSVWLIVKIKPLIQVVL